MLPQSIIDKILTKYGKEKIFSADCAPLAAEIGISGTTVKRMFGLVGANSVERNRTPHNSTMDLLAKWLGYGSYDALLREVGEGNYSSEFTSMESIETDDLDVGTQIRVRYDPSRLILMTYLGENKFVVNESKNSKLLKGDRLHMTHIVLNQELIVREVIRDGKSLGGYIGAKDGGLTSLEIIT